MSSGTKYTEIYDLFMMLINDYNLVELYNSSAINFGIYLQGWLIFSIVEFSKCRQNLNARDDTAGTFSETLTLEVQTILAQLMVKYWMKKEVQDIMQMKLHVIDKDFRTYAESANLKEKSNHLQTIVEQASQTLMDYGLRANDWVAWGSGNFLGG